ncbi:hypothetical protein [Gemmobacter sp. 24YEA27]|uniref:hypothetical protein n=1 Tax=Gemmobacter sp. 24YEA27 TaxID=3040672 RepID=UPI0024B32C4B|nr:hypothetical protein [Gemmobacter sp. 24YEA27]
MDGHTIPHTCKGSLAIAEETIEVCWDDPAAAAQVLAFAAIIAALKAGITIGELAQHVIRMEEPARVLTGTGQLAKPAPNCARCEDTRFLDSHLILEQCPDCNPEIPK